MLQAASTLTIIFVGLIAHVQLPGTTLSTAVLPEDHEHRAVLTFQRADVSGIPLPEWCSPFQPVCRIPLANTHVKISGLPRVKTDLTGVEEVIPSLTTVATCKYLASAVVRREPTPVLTAFVDYSGGSLAPRSYFKKMGAISDLPGWDVPRCLGCEIEYKATLLDDKATVTLIRGKDERQIVFQSGAELIVSNNYRNADTATSSLLPPFLSYFEIFEDTCQIPTIDADGECQRGAVCNIPELPGPSSTQSRFP